MLSAAAVNELIRELRSPDVTPMRLEDIKSEIVTEHQGLIRHFIRLRDPQIYEDLVQVGAIGVLAAIDQFDLDMHTAFSTFAAEKIKGEISHYLRDNGTIRIPRSIQTNLNTIRKAQEQFTIDHNKVPTFTDLVDSVELTRSDVYEAIMANQSGHISSLSDPDQHLELAVNQREYDFVVEWESVRPAIDLLTPLDRKILGMRFIEQKKQNEIAQELGMNQMAVSRRLNAIMRELRAQANAA